MAYTFTVRPNNEFFEQGGVSALRVLGLTAFVPQVLQKIFNQSTHFGYSRVQSDRRATTGP